MQKKVEGCIHNIILLQEERFALTLQKLYILVTFTSAQIP